MNKKKKELLEIGNDNTNIDIGDNFIDNEENLQNEEKIDKLNEEFDENIQVTLFNDVRKLKEENNRLKEKLSKKKIETESVILKDFDYSKESDENKFSVCVYNKGRLDNIKNLILSLKANIIKNSQCDFELVISDNTTNKDNYNELKSFVNEVNITFRIKYIAFSHFVNNKYNKSINQNSIGFNIAIENATYNKIILTVSDSIFEVDNIKNAYKVYNPNKIIFGNCVKLQGEIYSTNFLNKVSNNLSLEYKANEWKEEFERENKHFTDLIVYKSLNSNPYFFIAVFNKEKFLQIGGMDERFIFGMAKGDNDFADRISHNNCPFDFSDELNVVHIYHVPLVDVIGVKRFLELEKKNEVLWYENKKKAQEGNFRVNLNNYQDHGKCIFFINYI